MNEVSSYPKAIPSKIENRWVLIFAILVMMITCLPIFIGYQNSGHGWDFSGFVFSMEDSNNYIAKMHRGASGDWLFRTPYTSPPHEGVLAYSFYIGLGKLASPPGIHIQLVVLFHLARCIAGMLAIYAMYGFVAVYIENIRQRRYAILLITLGGGVGWLVGFISGGSIFGSPSLELYSPESFSFLMLYGLPHLCLARALLFWGLTAYLRSICNTTTVQWREAGKIGLFWLLIGLIQPATAVLAWILIGIHFGANFLFLSWKLGSISQEYLSQSRVVLINLLIIVSVSSLPVVYMTGLYALPNVGPGWVFQFLREQNQIFAPHPVQYLIAYGVFFLPITIFAVIGFYHFNHSTSFLIFWLIVLPIFLYSPTNIQRRLAEGVWVAIVTLLFIGISKAPGIVRTYLPPVLTLLSLPASIILITGGLIMASSPEQPVFIPSDLIETFHYLSANSSSEDVVLSSYSTGNALPAWSPNFVVIGHGPETIGIDDLREEVDYFYQASSSDDFRQKLLRQYDVDYIVLGENEFPLGTWDPAGIEYLHLVYHNETFQLYEVVLP